jgi:molecular chaperone GrpE
MSIFKNDDQELLNLKDEVRTLRQQVQNILDKMKEEPSAPETPLVEVVVETPVPEEVKEEKTETPEPEPIVAEKEEKAEKPVTPAPVTACPDLDGLKEQMKVLAEKIDTAAYQEGIIRDLHEELQQYKKGLIAEISKGYIMDIINLYERIADTNAHFNPEEADFDAKKVKHLVENNMLSITDLLEDQYSVECYAPEPASEYKPKEHKAMRVIETDDPAKGATIAECLGCGFRNSDTGKIFRPARVVVYRLKQ